ncbi:MAG: hypothetical protein ACRDPO_18920 [Streptosporangiaceae bacterium]
MLLQVCPTEADGLAPVARWLAVVAAGVTAGISGLASPVAQNLSDPLILDLLNGATCACQLFVTAALAVAPTGRRGKCSSANSRLLAVAALKPDGGAVFSKLTPSGSTYL